MLKEYNFHDSELKRIWEALYRGNPYLFPFSSYEYNDCVYTYKKYKPNQYLQKNIFLVYYEENKPQILLPLTIKKDEIFIFGDNISGCDNLDLVYCADVKDQTFENMLQELASRFSNCALRFYKINERSRFYEYVSRNQDILMEKNELDLAEERVCVKIQFLENYAEYFSSLSRNSRSNLKKAYNKVMKTNTEMKLIVAEGPIHDSKLLSQMMHVYAHRESERKKRTFDYFSYVKNCYFSVLSWNAQKMESQYTFCLFLNRKLAAFMSGFKTNFEEIVFPRVAMNSQYSKYAPGKLMISKSVKWLQKHRRDINVLDLSRGDERYKYEMGGANHMNYRFFMRLKK